MTLTVYAGVPKGMLTSYVCVHLFGQFYILTVFQMIPVLYRFTADKLSVITRMSNLKRKLGQTIRFVLDIHFLNML